MFVLDSHCDTPSQIHRLRDISLEDSHAHVDLPKLKKGGVDGAFFAIYTPASKTSEEAYRYASSLLDETVAAVSSFEGKAALACSVGDALSNQQKGIFSVFLGLENGSPLGEDLSRIEEFYGRGIRYITLCHSADNAICDSCASLSGRWNGLSPFGREVVRQMNRMGMLVDVSHLSDKSFYDVLNCSSKPVAASHSCCRSLADHPRNMTDEMIKALAENGGVIQINFYPVFLDSDFSRTLRDSGISSWAEALEDEFIADPGNPGKREAWYEALDRLAALQRPSFTKIVDHIDHAVSLVGVEHVGLGSDFDGIDVTPEGMENASCFPLIFRELSRRGYSDSDISMIAGGNFLRILSL